MYIAKLSFNFNFNLVESWDSIIISSVRPSVRPASEQEKYIKEQQLNYTVNPRAEIAYLICSS